MELDKNCIRLEITDRARNSKIICVFSKISIAIYPIELYDVSKFKYKEEAL
jgi:hypothetical protein